MTAELPPINSDDRRHGERRADWHTPNGCFKLLDVQTTMDRIFARLQEGDARMDAIVKGLEDADVRMGCLEDNVTGNHRIVSADIKALEAMMEANKKALDENTAKTHDIYEIVEMGRGFFKGVAFIGKWLRRIVMFVVPPIAAVIGLWQSIRPPK